LAVCSVCAVIRFQSGMVSAEALGNAARKPMTNTDAVSHQPLRVVGRVREGNVLAMFASF